jgi:hypothetical protein
VPGGEFGGSTQGMTGGKAPGATVPLASLPLLGGTAVFITPLVALAFEGMTHLQRQQVWGLSPASLPGGIVARRLHTWA